MKKKTKTFIYRSINKYIIKDSLYSTWVFVEKWGKKRDWSYKKFWILVKMQNGTHEQIRGGKRKENQQHISWFVFSVFVNAASLFTLAQTWVKSQTVRHDDT